MLKESRDEYYTADSLNTLFETTPENGQTFYTIPHLNNP